MIMIDKPDSVLYLLNKMNKNYLIEKLFIEFIHVDLTTLTAKMPINDIIYQPDGIMNGGYALILAEVVGSSLSFIHINKKKYQVLGMNISLNHLRIMKNGYIYVKACFVKKGFFIHTVKIELYNESNDLISFAILTNFIKKK